MNELMEVSRGELIQMVAEGREALAVSAAQLKQMALTITAMGAEMREIRKELKRMRKLLPVQVSEINQMVRERSAELAGEYRLPEDKEKSVNAFIRGDIKKNFGGVVKDCAAEDYTDLKAFVQGWQDTKRLRGLRN